MSFCLGTPKLNSQVETLEILKIKTFVTLKAYNFLFRPPIEVRFETKSYPLLRAFQQYVAHHLHIIKSGRFLFFTSWESNWHFNFRPLFQP